jgi:N6-adenosine-specific RNA methylase IME4
VSEIAAEHAALIIWYTGPKTEDAVHLARAWGFQPATVAFVWNKGTAGLRRGRHTHAQVEFAMIATRGEARQKLLANPHDYAIEQLIDAPPPNTNYPDDLPEEFWNIVDKLFRPGTSNLSICASPTPSRGLYMGVGRTQEVAAQQSHSVPQRKFAPVFDNNSSRNDDDDMATSQPAVPPPPMPRASFHSSESTLRTLALPSMPQSRAPDVVGDSDDGTELGRPAARRISPPLVSEPLGTPPPGEQPQPHAPDGPSPDNSKLDQYGPEDAPEEDEYNNR